LFTLQPHEDEKVFLDNIYFDWNTNMAAMAFVELDPGE
jgi:hypothetical protein